MIHKQPICNPPILGAYKEMEPTPLRVAAYLWRCTKLLRGGLVRAADNLQYGIRRAIQRIQQLVDCLGDDEQEAKRRLTLLEEGKLSVEESHIEYIVAKINLSNSQQACTQIIIATIWLVFRTSS
jgi:hypothetical protein